VAENTLQNRLKLSGETKENNTLRADIRTTNSVIRNRSMKKYTKRVGEDDDGDDKDDNKFHEDETFLRS
jgi:hypothetical protein